MPETLKSEILKAAESLKPEILKVGIASLLFRQVC